MPLVSDKFVFLRRKSNHSSKFKHEVDVLILVKLCVIVLRTFLHDQEVWDKSESRAIERSMKKKVKKPKRVRPNSSSLVNRENNSRFIINYNF